MFYIVNEIQQAANGQISVLATPKTDWNEAQSTFFSICAAASISAIPYHAANIIGDNGLILKCEVFDRRAE